MKYIECPNDYNGTEKSIFLGGGISNCGNWQEDMAGMLSETNLVVINPRRRNFDISDATMTVEQIEWEYRYLNSVSGILFWFPPETLCPITLYELGAHAKGKTPIFIGTDLNYQKKDDVRIQLSFARPYTTVVYSLEKLAEQVKRWSRL